MDGHQFEYFCADLLRKNGFREVKVTKASNDHGVDILATRSGKTYAIQCKHYNSSKVDNGAVQEAFSGAAIYRTNFAAVLTNNYFTKPAQAEAARTSVILWNRNNLLNEDFRHKESTVIY